MKNELEIIEEIKPLLFTYRIKEITEIINQKHDTNYKVSTFKTLLSKYKISNSSAYLLLTDEVQNWIKENDNKYNTQKELLDALNIEFNCAICIPTFRKYKYKREKAKK